MEEEIEGFGLWQEEFDSMAARLRNYVHFAFHSKQVLTYSKTAFGAPGHQYRRSTMESVLARPG